MQLELEAHGLAIDPGIRDFVHSTLVFATWHDAHDGRIFVRLARLAATSRESCFQCVVRAEIRGRSEVLVTARGQHLCEAVQEAADRLEVALCETHSESAPCAADRLAA